jgi:uncharacterized protein (TIGR02145 family)
MSRAEFAEMVKETDAANVSAVTVGGVAVDTFSITSATTLTFVLPDGVTTGTNVISLTLGGATVTQSGVLGVDAVGYAVPTMQNFSADKCAAMTIYDGTNATAIKTMIDSRNSQQYRVAKLADGNCWMIDNLKLANYTVTASDGNVTSNYTLPAAAASGDSSITAGQVWNAGRPSSATNTSCGSVNTGSTTCWGYLYNFYAVTAGWGTASIGSGNSPQDICPKNWRLPTGGSGGEFQALYATSQFGSTYTEFLPSGAFAGVYSGLYYDEFSGRGSHGYFWSSSVSSTAGAYGLSITSSSVGPTGGIQKDAGSAVRCLAK